MAAAKRKKTEVPTIEQKIASKQKYYCCRCGNAFCRQKTFFPASHSPMYRGSGYLPFCNNCLDDMYDQYRKELGSDREAMKRMCMKMDLYWSDAIYNMVEKSAGVKSRIRSYIGKSNITRYIDKNYDDTIAEEAEKMSVMPAVDQKTEPAAGDACLQETEEEQPEEPVEIEESVRLFWGPGYTPDMYMELEERRKYWMSRYPAGAVLDIGEEALIRQICSLEIDINHERANGKSVDKLVNTLNTILGSARLKPDQKKDTESDANLDKMAFGVGIRKWENTRPVPEPDPELQDVDGIIKYIQVWFLGHLSKMVGLKNTYCKMYEEELERMKVNKPEFQEEDDDVGQSYSIFGGNGEDE